MYEILLSQPATCLFPVFVLVLLFWALWTRRDGVVVRYPPPGPRRNAAGSAAPSDGIRSVPPADVPIPPALRGLHTSRSADYDVKFDEVSKRIRRWD